MIIRYFQFLLLIGLGLYPKIAVCAIQDAQRKDENQVSKAHLSDKEKFLSACADGFGRLVREPDLNLKRVTVEINPGDCTSSKIKVVREKTGRSDIVAAARPFSYLGAIYISTLLPELQGDVGFWLRILLWAEFFVSQVK